MPILPPGSVNPNSLIAPGVYISPQLPAPPLTGAPTDIILFVGTAIGGPVNAPVTCFGLQEYINIFGTPQNSTYDMGTQVMIAASMRAYNFVCVRVTDGTDVKADADILDTATPTPAIGMTVTAKNSGTLGNQIKIIISEGTNSTVSAPTYKVTILYPTGTGNSIPENFDNIGGAGATLWQNMVNAINLGQGSLAPPSALVTAAIGVSTGTPDLETYTLAGGTTGNSGVNAASLVGDDTTTPREGMYAARDVDFDLMVLSNVSDGATYIEQVNFAESQAAYAILTRPSNESFTAGITAKKAISFDPNMMAWGKLMVGDWVRVQDNFNKVQRYVSPQSFVAGKLANLAPEQSGLNKPMASSLFLGTQISDNNGRYTADDIAQILLNGLDVIARPSPGGFYFAEQTGKNLLGNLNILANGDEFTRNTDFLMSSIQDFAGPYIGRLISDSESKALKAGVVSFLANLWAQEKIGLSNDPRTVPYLVSVDNSESIKGIQILNVEVAFLKVLVVLLVNLQTGVASISSVNNQI